MIQVFATREEPATVIPLITKEELRDQLKTKVADIEFEKVDGSMRKMKCTLIPNLVPPLPVAEEQDPEKVVRIQNDNVLPVWDLETDAWRSIRVRHIKSILYHAD